MDVRELYKKFLKELDRGLTIDHQTRDYWLKNYETLPVSAVMFFYENLLKINKQVDSLVIAGVDANTKLGLRIAHKCRQVKKKGHNYFEEQCIDEENPEAFLKNKLI